MVFRDDGKSGRYIFNQQVFKVVGGADQFDVVAVIEIDVAVLFAKRESVAVEPGVIAEFIIILRVLVFWEQVRVGCLSVVKKIIDI